MIILKYSRRVYGLRKRKVKKERGNNK